MWLVCKWSCNVRQCSTLSTRLFNLPWFASCCALTRHGPAQLGQRCGQADLAKLRAALTAVTEPLFDYDKQYICEFMGWGQPGAAAR